MPPRLSLAALSFILLFPAAVRSAEEHSDVVFKSGPTQTTLLELYTSEGCESCPPADRWVSSLMSRGKLWKDVVPVVFHVDYWDYLGWKDPFASKSFSKRQRSYSLSWKGKGGVYTPGFVLNGREWRGWYFAQGLPRLPQKKSGTLKVSAAGQEFTLSFNPSRRAKGFSFDAALLGFDLTTKVPSGENAGKTLKHDFVVLSHVQGRLSAAKDSYTASFRFKDPKAAAKRRAVAVWVTEKDAIKPVQAAGGFLPMPAPKDMRDRRLKE